MRNYGITPDEYSTLFEAQHGLCASCGNPERDIDPRTHIPHYLHVDHDHATGKVRALLCKHCNAALGHMKDDPERIKKLLAYAQSRCNTTL